MADTALMEAGMDIPLLPMVMVDLHPGRVHTVTAPIRVIIPDMGDIRLWSAAATEDTAGMVVAMDTAMGIMAAAAMDIMAVADLASVFPSDSENTQTEFFFPVQKVVDCFSALKNKV
jgi:hypothetical protein